MKKIIFLLAAVIAINFSFAQIQPSQNPVTVTNQEVASIIAMSKEANFLNGVYDPNKIIPGQNLTFLFKNGKTAEITVESGDNQWFIVKNKISNLVKQNGGVVPFVDPVIAEDTPSNPTVVETTPWYYTPNLLWAALVLALLLALIIKRKQIKDYFTERRQSNFATDNPMVAGGIPDSEAVRHMDRVAQRANVTRFGPVTKGRLTTFYRQRVLFANGGRKMRLTNAHVFMSQARRNSDNSLCWIAYVQICANDACEIDMSRARFVPDQVQSPALQTANRPVTETVVEQPPVFSGSKADFATIISAITSPMNGKDNGKLEVKFNGVEIKMEFSTNSKGETLLLSNGKSPETATVIH